MSSDRVPLFQRYIGIDYSGAEAPISSLKALRIYEAAPVNEPEEVPPPPSPRKYWTRKGIAGWLAETFSGGSPTLVGINHGFSFPLAYFEEYRLPLDWPAFLEDFCAHWPTGEDYVYVDFVREGMCGKGALRQGNPRWRRLVEVWIGSAKTVFHFDILGSVAKSTHAGLPWLRFLRHQLGNRVHFWPFDGWQVEPGKSVIAEVYPPLWNKRFPMEGRTQDQQDAYSICAWMRQTDSEGRLREFLEPRLGELERKRASFEGWILGVV
jgi:hypothetical protein